MRKSTLLLLLAATGFGDLSAQTQYNLNQFGCATVTTQEEIQRVYDFAQAPPVAYKTTNNVDSLPLSIHIVGKSDGSGYYSLESLFSVICALNTKYAPVNMFFYIKWPIRYINNSSYYEHNNSNGAQMMYQNNVANTINVYFVEDPAGACGYYNPGPHAVAIAKKCSAPASTTLVHELGHYLGLPHTFFGWENRTAANPPNNPERVARSGAGANCSSRGDGFCDTDADFQSDRWSCPYSGTYQDANGDAYRPDASLYMGYATDACMNRFSSQQIAFMQSQLHSQPKHTVLLNNNDATPYISLTEPNIVYPADQLYSNYQKIIWNRVPGAEYYYVKIYRSRLLVDAFIQQEALTQDTFLMMNFQAQANTTLSVRIEPLMSTNVCRASNNTHQFVSTSETTTMSVDELTSAGRGVQIVPNPVTGSSFRVDMGTLASGRYELTLMNMNGQRVSHTGIDHAGNNTVQISVQHLPAGMYFLNISGTGVRQTQKVMVQH